MITAALSRSALVLALLSAGTATLAQTPTPAPAPIPSPTSALTPSPGSIEPDSAQRFHAHRPGSDVYSDTMDGNIKSERYTVQGHVVLHSDPSVDHAASGSESDLPITLTADRVDVDEKAKRYVAHGSVHFMQGTREGSCDDAMLDDVSHDLDLIGHAHISEAGQTLSAHTFHYNTKTREYHGEGDVTILAPLPTATPLPPGVTPAPAPKKKKIPALPL
jgi:lipopolysaccharide assembly outer membrane protein LptD (OstA)